MAKKKRLVLDVSADQFKALKALQRLLHLNSAEDVLLHCTELVAQVIVTNPDGAFALGVAAWEQQKNKLHNTERDAGKPSMEKEDRNPTVGTNLGDRLRDAMGKKKG